MTYYEYGQKEIAYLKSRDPKLGKAIDRIGFLRRPVTADPFAALLSCIVSQQISKKAAETVQGRLEALVKGINPKSIASCSLAAIQGCGMSGRKASYIKEIADAALSGSLDFWRLKELPDEEVINSLIQLPGIGIWTAEMLLIFSFCRPDVVSFRDLAIRRGMMRLYGLRELKRREFDCYREGYSPYGSVASLYLWSLSVE